MKKFLLASAVTLSACAFAQNDKAASSTTLEKCVIQEVIPGKEMTGAFLEFHHKGAEVDLKGAKIPSITDNVELHQMVMKDNVMVMAPLENLKIPEGVREFRKGGDHLMLMQIPKEKFPKAGDKHNITVEFSDGTSASCEAEVKTVEDVIKLYKKDGDMAHGH